jgi:hypothetical protein
MNTHRIERERKLNAIIDRLARGGYTVHYAWGEFESGPHAIDRHTLKVLIMGAINETNRHTLSAWIDYLLSLKVISANPTSNISPHGHIMPTDDTKYFINRDKLVDTHSVLRYRVPIGNQIPVFPQVSNFFQLSSIEEREVIEDRISIEYNNNKNIEKDECNSHTRNRECVSNHRT